MPFITMASLKRASAQVETGPVWAIVEFADKAPKRLEGLGASAANALSAELAKTNKYDIVPADTVNRTLGELGYENPVTDSTQLARIGQALRASTIVSGEIVNYRVVKNGAGKYAEVKLRVIVQDVASGKAINGAALLASSGTRTGEIEDATLIAEAINSGAYLAVQAIQSRTLPTATVLNTLDRTALINQGSRTGFANNQDVIVIRGREQVATGVVKDVEPDSAFVQVQSQTKGIQPGDKVRVVFSVPQVRPEFGAAGDVGVVKARGKGSSAAIISLLLVVGLLFVLLGQGHGNSNNVLTDVAAEPYLTPDNRMGVGVNIRADAFVPATSRVQWQLWRSDVVTGPVAVQANPNPNMTDEGRVGETFSWYAFDVVGSLGPNCPALPGGTDGAAVALVSGVPYLYSVELVFSVSGLDQPNAGSDSSSSSSGGGTGGGTYMPKDAPFSFDEAMFQDNGGNGGNGGSGGSGGTGSTEERCYGITTRTTASGSATPFQWGADALRAPDNVTVSTAPVFRFDSMRSSGQVYTLEYALQFSPSPVFPANETQTVLRFFDTSGLGTLSTPPVPEALTAFAGSRRLYWRMGVRNYGDNPGPRAVNGERYIFSGPKYFDRPSLPPNP